MECYVICKVDVGVSYGVIVVAHCNTVCIGCVVDFEAKICVVIVIYLVLHGVEQFFLGKIVLTFGDLYMSIGQTVLKCGIFGDIGTVILKIFRARAFFLRSYRVGVCLKLKAQVAQHNLAVEIYLNGHNLVGSEVVGFVTYGYIYVGDAVFISSIFKILVVRVL